jgi:hypothetical protein
VPSVLHPVLHSRHLLLCITLTGGQLPHQDHPADHPPTASTWMPDCWGLWHCCGWPRCPLLSLGCLCWLNVMLERPWSHRQLVRLLVKWLEWLTVGDVLQLWR